MTTEDLLAELAELYTLTPPRDGEITVKQFMDATGLHTTRAYRTLEELVERGEMVFRWGKVNGKRAKLYRKRET